MQEEGMGRVSFKNRLWGNIRQNGNAASATNKARSSLDEYRECYLWGEPGDYIRQVLGGL